MLLCSPSPCLLHSCFFSSRYIRSPILTVITIIHLYHHLFIVSSSRHRFIISHPLVFVSSTVILSSSIHHTLSSSHLFIISHHLGSFHLSNHLALFHHYHHLFSSRKPHAPVRFAESTRIYFCVAEFCWTAPPSIFDDICGSQTSSSVSVLVTVIVNFLVSIFEHFETINLYIFQPMIRFLPRLR